MSPRVSGQRVLAIGCEVFCKLTAYPFREARADADMLQRAGVVEKAEQERADSAAFALLMPSKAGNDTIAIALVLDLEHHALIRFVGSRNQLSDDAVEPGALKATKPVRRYV